MNPDFLIVPTGSLVVPAAIFSESPLQFSLILPTYQERDNISEIVQILTNLLDPIFPEQYELIVVDDDSPDGTWQVAAQLMPEYPQLQVMRRQAEKTLSTAVIRGWQAARGNVLGVIDADLQHPPQVLLDLWQEMVKGADLAVGSRHIEGGGVSEWSLLRRCLSRGAQMLGLLILPEVMGRLSDPMSGYFMVRRGAIAQQIMSPLGYKILIEVAARGRIRWIGEVGYVFRERETGESKVTWKQYVEYLQHLIRLRFSLWPVQRFIRFGVVGLSGIVVNMAVFYLLRAVLGLGLTRSAILAAQVAIMSNFLWNDLWTFGDIASRQKGYQKCFKRLLKFNAICLSGLILNVLVLNLLFNVFELDEYVGQLVAIASVMLWNFWFNVKLSWRVTDAQ